MPEIDDAPAWAGPEVFPAKPEKADYGALSRKGRRSEFQSMEALCAHVQSSRESVEAVWTPELERMAPPEAVPELLEPLRQRFIDLAENDAADARRISLIFIVVLVWALYAAFANKSFDFAIAGLTALLLVVIGLIPWYDAWKARREAWELNEENLAEEEGDARFDYWLDRQRRILTVILLGFLGVAGLIQIWVGLDHSIEAAGLVKPEYAAGAQWRLLTAPFLHGHPLHWAMNASAFWYLGRRVEALARWPHLALVFLMSMIVGGIATATMMPGPTSLGASGGVLGLLGFLLVFETLHSRLVPHSTRRRLFAGLILSFIIGLLGYRFIDNWAHGGGLAAGMLYAVIVFPKSRSARRPLPNKVDLALGGVAVLVLTASVLLAVVLMLAS